MPNALADALFERLRDAFPAERAYPPEAFDQPPMPPPVARFLTCRLRQHLGREAEGLARPTSPWLDADQATVDEAWQRLVRALTQHGQYPPAAWEDALREAVEYVTAFLVRPATTLAALVFPEGAAARPASAVMPLLQCFAAYDYLHEGVRMYLQQEPAPETDRERFEALLRRIDRQVTQDYDADAWLGLLSPLLDLAHRADDAGGVPVWLLRAFFRDKDAHGIVERLDAAQEQRGLMRLDEATLRHLLEAPAPTPEPATPAEDAAPVAPEPQDEAEAPAPEAEASLPEEAASTPEAPGGVPLWKQFQREPGHEPSTERTAPATPAATATDAIPRWKQFRKPASPAAAHVARPAAPPRIPPASAAEPAPAPTVLTVSAAEQARFIDELFRGNETHYYDVLRRLESSPDWDAASRLIAQEVFARHDVDIYSDAAVRFTDAVQARFA